MEPNGMVTPFFKPATSALADLPQRVATTEWMAYLLHKAMDCYFLACIFIPILVSLLKRIDDLEVPEPARA